MSHDTAGREWLDQLRAAGATAADLTPRTHFNTAATLDFRAVQPLTRENSYRWRA